MRLARLAPGSLGVRVERLHRLYVDRTVDWQAQALVELAPLAHVVEQNAPGDHDHVVDNLARHPDHVDFTDIARQLCAEIQTGRDARGVMVCGTGVGAAIAANKLAGIRAAVCHDVYSAHQCVEHDDVNVLCVGAQIVGDRLALDLVRTYLAAEFSTAPEFRRRVAKLADLERTIQLPDPLAGTRAAELGFNAPPGLLWQSGARRLVGRRRSRRTSRR